MLALVAAGTCSITASQPGDNVTWGPAASVTVTFTVDPSFGDVSSANESQAFITAIDDMLSKGISAGCQASPLEYCPSQDVTRGQMAVFIIRSIYGSSNFTYTQTPYFTDATPALVGAVFPFIQKMRDLGITSGCTTTTYCPNDNVTRGQMAVFIILARYGGLNFDYPSTPYFTDATTASVGGFFKYIQRMKQDNITAGCTRTTYCPNQNVTRDQMAVFMMAGGFNLAPPTAAYSQQRLADDGRVGRHHQRDADRGEHAFRPGDDHGYGESGNHDRNRDREFGDVLDGGTDDCGERNAKSDFAIGNDSGNGGNGGSGAAERIYDHVRSGGRGDRVLEREWHDGELDFQHERDAGERRNLRFGEFAHTGCVPDAQAFILNGTNSYVQAGKCRRDGYKSVARERLPPGSIRIPSPGWESRSWPRRATFFGVTGTTGTCSSGGQYQLYVDHGGTCYVSDISLAPGVWSFVAVTFDGSRVVFYIDGVASLTVPAQINNYGLATYEIGMAIRSGEHRPKLRSTVC